MTGERNDHHDHDGPRSSAAPSGLDATDWLVWALLAASGLGLWIWAASLTDAEAWDHNAFWSVVLPAMALLSGAAGWIRPRTARFAGPALVVPQAIALFATSAFSPLAIVGLLFFVVFALIFTGVATLAGALRNRFIQRGDR